jgi:hypothetical protein
MKKHSLTTVSFSLLMIALLLPAMAWGRPVNPQYKTFHNPTIGGKFVDRCLYWARQCNKPAADRFCQLAGFAGASSWRWDYKRPTVILGSGRVCDLANPRGCGGFSQITCIRTQAGPSTGMGTRPNPYSSGQIVARIENKGRCRYRGGPNPGRTSNYLCPVNYSLVNTTSKDIIWSSGWAQGLKPYGRGADRERIGYRGDLRPGRKMILGNACVIPHGQSVGTLTLWGTGYHARNPNKTQFTWRLVVRCP